MIKTTNQETNAHRKLYVILFQARLHVFIFQYGIKIPIFDIPRVLDYLQKVERLLILPPIMLSLTVCKGPPPTHP